MRKNEGKGRMWKKKLEMLRKIGKRKEIIKKLKKKKLVKLLRSGKKVKIGMGEGKEKRIIDLEESECGDWKIKKGIVGNSKDDRKGERGFEGKKIEGKGYEI